MQTVKAYGTDRVSDQVFPINIQRRKIPLPKEVFVKILYCGVCHSDKHHISNDWHDSKYPMVPGHEIVGKVFAIGQNVTKYKVGDIVAIGNMLDSCRACVSCSEGEEQYCANKGPTWTYNSRERIDQDGKHTLLPIGRQTYGGYSEYIGCMEDFIIDITNAAKERLHEIAPLLCAGITIYYPLKHYRIGKGHKIGIAGIGGLGHLAIKVAKRLFNVDMVVALTTSEWKVDDAVDNLEADDAVLMTDELKLEKYKGELDFIIDTIPYSHPTHPYLRLLKAGKGKLHVVGNMNNFEDFEAKQFVWHGRSITGSNVAGVSDTQEFLDKCIEHDIYADVELINPDSINKAFQTMIDSRVRYRHVIRMPNKNC